jgi:hypothetical protein
VESALHCAVLHLMENMIIPLILALTNDSTLRDGDDGTEIEGKELLKRCFDSIISRFMRIGLW